MLVGFSDGGNVVSCAAVYLRSRRLKVGPNGETHRVRLVVGKARVTPLSKAAGNLRKSTPRTEMRGGVLVARLITAILDGLPYKPAEIFVALDSQCTISALEAKDKILGIWFTNRVSEINDHKDEWKRRSIVVHPVHHWPDDHVADLGTKGKATVKDVAPGLHWQCGLISLSYPK